MEKNKNSMNKIDKISKYILSYYSNHYEPIGYNNLNKILYRVWIDYYDATTFELFDDDFLAYSSGPVIYSIYEKYYSTTGPFPIYENNYIQLPTFIKKSLLDAILNKYSYLNGIDLNKLTKKCDGAWYKTYNLYGSGNIISKYLIKRIECKDFLKRRFIKY